MNLLILYEQFYLRMCEANMEILMRCRDISAVHFKERI
jgi:hypothetical protein